MVNVGTRTLCQGAAAGLTCKVRHTCAPAVTVAAAIAAAAAYPDASRSHTGEMHDNCFFALPQRAPTQREEARKGERSHQGKGERPGAP